MIGRPDRPDRRWLLVCVGATLVGVAALVLPSALLTAALGDDLVVSTLVGLAVGITAGLAGVALANADLRRRGRRADRSRLAPPTDDY